MNKRHCFPVTFLILLLSFRIGVAQDIALGVYVPSQGASGRPIDSYTKQVGRKPAFAWLPATWERKDGSYVQFDPAVLEQFRTRGIMPGLNWDPSKGSTESYTDRQKAINQTDFSWKAINSGKHDDYITQVAKEAAAYHNTFMTNDPRCSKQHQLPFRL